MNELPVKHPIPFPVIMNPAGLAGLFCLCMLLGCQTVASPEQVTGAFWDAMSENDMDSARKYATRDSRHLVGKQQNLEGSSIKTGSSVIEEDKASVKTVITLQKPENGKVLAFDTVLVKEDRQWKVDYQQTLNNLSNLPIGDLLKSLRAIGDTINKELENHLPLIEQQIRSFSEELIKQLDDFRKQLEKSRPEKQDPLPPGTI